MSTYIKIHEVGPKEVQSSKLLQESINHLIDNQNVLHEMIVDLALLFKKGVESSEKTSKKS